MVRVVTGIVPDVSTWSVVKTVELLQMEDGRYYTGTDRPGEDGWTPYTR